MELAARRAIKATSEKRLDRHQLLTVETSDAIARGPASPVSPGTPSPSAETVGEEEVRARYALGAVLGRGSYGVVFGGCDRRHTAAPEVAVKMLRRSNDRRDRKMQAEVRILKQMQHRNVVRLFDVMQTEGKLYIVTELMACDLCAYVESHRVPEPFVCDWSRQLLRGVEYLHAHKVIHRDLKPQNLLLSADLSTPRVGTAIAPVHAPPPSTRPPPRPL